MKETRENFYNKHLSGVSRSFAACIARLNQPLRNYVGLTYLLCRTLDSIEDGLWKSKKQQSSAFKVFSKALKTGVSRRQQVPDSLMPEGISEAEKQLLRESPQLIQDIQQAPADVRNTILRLIDSMSQGMQYFVSKNKQGALRLGSLEELNRYCYFVAGVVGEALTALVAQTDGEMKLNEDTVRDAQHFGLFLQKVNILKDQAEDEKNGRFLVPCRESVFHSTQANALGAWRYIDGIPLSQKSYKIFCAWSFFVGLKTLPQLKAISLAPVKLKREETLLLFSDIENRINSGYSSLQDLFEKLLSQVEFKSIVDTPTIASDCEDKRWFLNNYQKVILGVPLPQAHLRDLSFGL